MRIYIQLWQGQLFTQRRGREILRRSHEWKPGFRGKEEHEQPTAAHESEGGYG